MDVNPTFLFVAIIILLSLAGYMMFRIRKSDCQFDKFRKYACEIAEIRLPVEFLSKRDELNVLMKDRLFMDYGGGKYYYTLDEMMDRKFDAILLDVEDIGKAAIFKQAVQRPSRKSSLSSNPKQKTG